MILVLYGEAMIAENLVRESYICRMRCIDPVVKVFFASDIIREEAAKLGKFVDSLRRC